MQGTVVSYCWNNLNTMDLSQTEVAPVASSNFRRMASGLSARRLIEVL
jgi:hypothetical protein